MLGYVALERSDYATARALEEEALALFKEVGDIAGIITALFYLAQVFAFQGEYEQARTLSEEALALSREGGNTWSIAAVLWLLALVRFFQGDLAQAGKERAQSGRSGREDVQALPTT